MHPQSRHPGLEPGSRDAALTINAGMYGRPIPARGRNDREHGLTLASNRLYRANRLDPQGIAP